MAKQDVLDAINATIAPNGIKAITAQSLNNVLTMMTENAGEGGSGDGALRVIVPEILMLGGIFIDLGEISPTSWEEVKLDFEAQFGDALSKYDSAVKASFEHNANIAQQIIEKGKAGQGVSVVLDQTPYLPASINLMLQLDPEYGEMIEDLAMCAVQPAGLYMQYMNATPEGEDMVGGDMFECVLAPAGNINIDGWSMTYPSNMLIFLNLDGSLTFKVIEEEQPSSGSGVEVVDFIIPTTGESLSASELAQNAESYQKVLSKDNSIVRIKGNDTEVKTLSSVIQMIAYEGAVICSIPEAISSNGSASFVTYVFMEDGTAEKAEI